jgi:hypothetical protein
LVVNDYGSLFLFRLQDATLYKNDSATTQHSIAAALVSQLSDGDARAMRGALNIDTGQRSKERNGDCTDCVAAPIVGVGDSALHDSSSVRRPHLINPIVGGGDTTAGPCEPAITQSNCTPTDPFGYTISITMGVSDNGPGFTQTCYYDGSTFDYSDDVCYANPQGNQFNLHGPLIGTIKDYYRDVPGGTTHAISNVDVNAPPLYPQEYEALYDDIKGGVAHDEDDHYPDGTRLYPTKTKTIDIYIVLTRTRFSHMRVDWFNLGLRDNPSNHTGSGEAWMARSNYVN